MVEAALASLPLLNTFLKIWIRISFTDLQIRLRDRVSCNTRNYRLEKMKQLSARELDIFWNVLQRLKFVIEDELSPLLEQEIEVRKKNRKLMGR